MSTDAEIDALAARLAHALHEQLVEGAARAALAEWRDPALDEGADGQYREISRFARSLSSRDQALLQSVVARTAADTLLKVGGLFSGSYGLGSVDGHEGQFTMTYEGDDVGEQLADRLRGLIEFD